MLVNATDEKGSPSILVLMLIVHRASAMQGQISATWKILAQQSVGVIKHPIFVDRWLDQKCRRAITSLYLTVFAN
jgi:hypothetical protein